ncbi:NXPE family member 3-like [Branchiostoma floridae]|uniref:NXPE family member 3-like n=1 Tax=Branchiostoma floridae TaxID=7739 RepID=A0A9J7HMH3_BRAFL|nr:NXPE family member 3-like [Branchiostoma floridae]
MANGWRKWFGGGQTRRWLGPALIFLIATFLLYCTQSSQWISQRMMKTQWFTAESSNDVPSFRHRWNNIVIEKPVLNTTKPFSPVLQTTKPFSAAVYKRQLKFSLASESGRQYSVGDMLRIEISAKDSQNNIVTNIGDFFRASILTAVKGKAGSGAVGIITDHQNGTYTATFRLLWEGEVTIKIQLVHPRQAIDVIERTIRKYPIDLVMFRKRYIVGKNTVIDTECNVDPAIFKNTSAVCNYSDPHAGAWWYCEKAANIPCNTSGYHGTLRYRDVKGGKLFSRGNTALKMSISGSPSKINVKKGQDPLANRRRCVWGLATPQISGFYRNGVWNSLVCKNRHFSSQAGWQQCLKGKTLHFMGDSTIRQWWEHFVRILKMKETHIPWAIHKTGPLLARDPVNNITLNYRAHGPPRRCPFILTFLLKYVANIIDEIEGGPNDVVGITMWAHFTSYPVEVYRKRMEAVRAAIERLLHRSPETLVVIKSANTAKGNELKCGDWLAHKLDLIMREMFRGMNVVLVDVWEMTNAQHWHGDAIHPAQDIIVQELEFLCSFICPL